MNRNRHAAAVALVAGCLAGPAVGQVDSMYGMTGMSGFAPGTYWMRTQRYMPGPYEGMYGSMGGVYGPYYQQFRAPVVSGTHPGPGTTWTSGQQYILNPQYGMAGMYGSMGNVYSPYYGQPQPSFMTGMAGMYPGSGAYWTSGQQYILNPQYGMAGMYGSMGNVYAPYSRQFPAP